MSNEQRPKVSWTILPNDVITCNSSRCLDWHHGHDEDELQDGDVVFKLYGNGAEECAVIGQGRIQIVYNTGDIVFVDDEDRVRMIITHDGRFWQSKEK
jgi:hypothetical protein